MRLFLIAVFAIVLPFAAQAYVGPGAGLGMLGSLLAVVGAVLLAMFGLLLLPMRLLMKRRRRQAQVGLKPARIPD